MIRTVFLACLLLALSAIALPAAAAVDSERVSVDSRGNQTHGPSGSYAHPPGLAANGRYVVFESIAATLADGDDNGVSDVFLRDVRTRTTTRVSIGSGGEQGNGKSYAPSVSADGRFVVFESLASNLVPGDNNAAPDVFLHDGVSGATTRLSAPPGGDSDGNSHGPVISPEGNFIAFCSAASNLVPDDTNGAADVFLYARLTGVLSRINQAAGGGQSAGGCTRVAIADGGGFIVFQSEAADLVAGDTNGLADVFRYNRETGEILRVSVGAGGGEADASSGNNVAGVGGSGRYVIFDSAASNLVDGETNGQNDVFVRDLQAQTTKRISQNAAGEEPSGDSGLGGASISRDGAFVVFESRADNLLAGDINGAADIFRYATETGELALVSVGVDGRAANNMSYSPYIDRYGDNVAFVSLASNVTYGDRNEQPDVFVVSGDLPAVAGEDRPAVTAAPAQAGNPADYVVRDEAGPPVLTIALVTAAVIAALAGAGWLVRGRLRRGSGD